VRDALRSRIKPIKGSVLEHEGQGLNLLKIVFLNMKVKDKPSKWSVFEHEGKD